MIDIVMGNKGGGKSTKLAEVARADLKRGRTVLCNFPMRGCKKVTIDDLMHAWFDPNTTILIDEAGRWWPSQAWDKVPEEVFTLFSQSRHMHLDLWVAVQFPMRLAKPLRELGDAFWWCERSLFGLAFRRWIWLNFDDFGKHGDNVSFQREFRWRNRQVWSMFDSWDLSLIGDRERREFPAWEVPEPVQRPSFWRRWVSGLRRVVGRVKLSRLNGGDPAGTSEPAGGATVHS